MADGSAVNGDVGVGVGVAINVADSDNVAAINQGSTVQGDSISVSASMAEVDGEDGAETTNSFGADATSGAGAATVGVAGSLALNTASSTSSAYVAGEEDGGSAAAVFTEGELAVQATNNASHTVAARASATKSDDGGNGDSESGKSVGIGASAGINTFTNEAVAEIRDGATVGGDKNDANAEAGSLTMSATSDYRSATSAEAGAEGEDTGSSNDIAVDAAVALAVADNQTRVTVGAADTSAGFSGDIDLDAGSDQSNSTRADGDAAGSAVAIGAVAAVNIGTSDTSINVGADLETSGGAISMDATSTSADKALAKASARGASKQKAQDKYGATEDEVDSGDFGNEPGDKKATSTTVLSDNSDSMKQSDTGKADADSRTEETYQCH